jgi:ABC-type Fe3+/spermidine/putrescine transport system ATPase subunit
MNDAPTTINDTILRIEALSKDFGPVRAVDGVSLDIRRNEFFALLGPSGCGKSTLLRMLAGFEMPSNGRILLEGKDISSLKPERRPLNLMFQSYALFPHMSVVRNIAYGLEMERLPRAEIRARVDEIMAVTDLTGFADRKPRAAVRRSEAACRARPRARQQAEGAAPRRAARRARQEAAQGACSSSSSGCSTRWASRSSIVTHDQEEALT